MRERLGRSARLRREDRELLLQLHALTRRADGRPVGTRQVLEAAAAAAAFGTRKGAWSILTRVGSNVAMPRRIALLALCVVAGACAPQTSGGRARAVAVRAARRRGRAGSGRLLRLPARGVSRVRRPARGPRPRGCRDHRRHPHGGTACRPRTRSGHRGQRLSAKSERTGRVDDTERPDPVAHAPGRRFVADTWRRAQRHRRHRARPQSDGVAEPGRLDGGAASPRGRGSAGRLSLAIVQLRVRLFGTPDTRGLAGRRADVARHLPSQVQGCGLRRLHARVVRESAAGRATLRRAPLLHRRERGVLREDRRRHRAPAARVRSGASAGRG